MLLKQITADDIQQYIDIGIRKEHGNLFSLKIIYQMLDTLSAQLRPDEFQECLSAVNIINRTITTENEQTNKEHNRPAKRISK